VWEISAGMLCIRQPHCWRHLHHTAFGAGETKSAIVLEGFNVSGMLKNHHLAQAIADVGMYEFKRQLQYKGEWHGCEILLAHRFYPSTKRCSACGELQEMGLKERQYHCPVCGLTMDRGLNADLNLEQLFMKETTVSPAGSKRLWRAYKSCLSGDVH
jgi:IS605 OrfB family transposase